MGNFWSSEADTTALKKLVEQQSKTIRKLESRIEELAEGSSAGGDPVNPQSGEPQTESRTFIKRAVIMSWVDKKLEDPDYNITAMPDFIERQFKTQMIELMLETMDFIIENTYTVLPGGHALFHDIRPLSTASHFD